MKELCILAFLAWNSWRDIRKHEISLTLTFVFGIGGLVLFWQNHESFWAIVGSASIGLGMMGVSILTRGGVGMGDGLLLLALSFFRSKSNTAPHTAHKKSPKSKNHDQNLKNPVAVFLQSHDFLRIRSQMFRHITKKKE